MKKMNQYKALNKVRSLNKLIVFYKKRTILLSIFVGVEVICYFVITSVVYDKHKITTPFKESIAIPLQQIARTVSYSGDIDEESREYLESILPLSEWKSLYRPMCVDILKTSSKYKASVIDEDKGKFFSTWGKIMISNLPEYIKAYLMETYGFWGIETKNEYGFVDTYIANNKLEIERSDYIKEWFGKSLEEVFYTKVDFLGSGTLFWIMAFSIVLLIQRKRNRYIISYVPAIVC